MYGSGKLLPSVHEYGNNGQGGGGLNARVFLFSFLFT